MSGPSLSGYHRSNSQQRWRIVANQETITQNECLLAVGQMPDVLAWRQQVGTFRAMDNPQRVVKVGTPGMADSMLVVAVTITPEMVGQTVGVAVATEFKTATGRQRQQQAAWQRAFQLRGGVYRLVRSVQDMLQLVDDVRSGKWP